MRPQRGFSLVELLVVVAILAIIAALLIPADSHGKTRAQRAVCTSKLRQINLGIHMYSDDSADATPSVRVTSTNQNHLPLYAGYKELVKNYLGLRGTSSAQDKPFACPADKFFPSFLYPNGTNWTRVEKSLHDDAVFDYSSYAFNGGDNVSRTFGTTNHYSLPGLTGLKVSSIKHPERTVLVAEASALAPWSWHQPSPHLIFSDAQNVVSFADGHASYIKIFWDSTPLPDGGVSFAIGYNPPAGYDY